MNGLSLKALRDLHHMSQAELAAASGVSERSIRDIETGRNTTPSQKTLDLLCAALCPDDPKTFESICNDSNDYTSEKALLDLYCGEIPSALIAPLNKLLDCKSTNAVSYCLSCLFGYLRNNHSCNDSIAALNAMAASMQSVTLSDTPSEMEASTRALINHLQTLSTDKSLTPDMAATAKDFAIQLSQLRLSATPDARLNFIRTTFYWLYDNWHHLNTTATAYAILSDISLLCNHASDSHSVRCSVFHEIINYFFSQN